MNDSAAKPVLICDTQPVAVEGVRGLLDRCADLRYSGLSARWPPLLN
jgi:hypothetical protein